LAKGKENWKQGRQKDLAVDIVVVVLEALGLLEGNVPDLGVVPQQGD
jgi:hypothetical protein